MQQPKPLKYGYTGKPCKKHKWHQAVWEPPHEFLPKGVHYFCTGCGMEYLYLEGKGWCTLSELPIDIRAIPKDLLELHNNR